MAFKDIDVGVLVGAMPRREGMERKDLLKANVKIFKQQGQALDQFAKKNVKVGTTRVVLGAQLCTHTDMLSKDGLLKGMWWQLFFSYFFSYMYRI